MHILKIRNFYRVGLHVLLREIQDPKLLMKRPRVAILARSKGVDPRLNKVQTNRAKTFKHFVAGDI